MADESSSRTSAIDHYDGIFKFVHSQAAKEPFVSARRLCASDQWNAAKQALDEAKSKCESKEDKETVELVKRELERYLRCKIAADTKPVQEIDFNKVYGRNLEVFEEDLDCLPQGIFVLSIPSESANTVWPVKLVGRKTLSQLWIADKIPEIFCSQVTAGMLLGFLQDWRMTDSKAVVFYKPLQQEEKLAFLETALGEATASSRVEIIMPFPLLKRVTRKEFTSPADGWDVDPNFDHALSHGEEHIRQFTVETLGRLGFDWQGVRLYDTACSTGVFLASLKQAFPKVTTIGQDLSRKMCDVASRRVDVVHCGSAIEPKIEPGTADVTFNRFLNSEVVTSAEAEILLKAIVPTVAPGGLLITFGHTPVLLSASNFSQLSGFELLFCTGTNESASSIFQYYVLRREK